MGQFPKTILAPRGHSAKSGGIKHLTGYRIALHAKNNLISSAEVENSALRGKCRVLGIYLSSMVSVCLASTRP